MRLDHLLSKEQLDRETGPVARTAQIVVVGCSMAETLASQRPATAGTLSTHVREDVLEIVVLVRLGDGDKHPVES